MSSEHERNSLILIWRMIPISCRARVVFSNRNTRWQHSFNRDSDLLCGGGRKLRLGFWQFSMWTERKEDSVKFAPANAPAFYDYSLMNDLEAPDVVTSLAQWTNENSSLFFALDGFLVFLVLERRWRCWGFDRLVNDSWPIINCLVLLSRTIIILQNELPSYQPTCYTCVVGITSDLQC